MQNLNGAIMSLVGSSVFTQRIILKVDVILCSLLAHHGLLLIRLLKLPSKLNMVMLGYASFS